jgi:hypothetical protein
MTTPRRVTADPAATASAVLIFGREPALFFAVLSSVLGTVVATGATGLTTDQAGTITAAASAVFAAITALFTRPVAPAAFTGAFAAVVTVLAAFHFNLSPELVGAGNGFITAVLLFATRGHVSPTTVRGEVVRPKALHGA